MRKIKMVINLSVCTMVIGTLFLGCTNLESLEKTVVISNDVKSQANEVQLKIDEEKVYKLENKIVCDDYGLNSVSVDKDNNIILSYLKGDKYVVEKIVLNNDSAKSERLQEISTSEHTVVGYDNYILEYITPEKTKAYDIRENKYIEISVNAKDNKELGALSNLSNILDNPSGNYSIINGYMVFEEMRENAYEENKSLYQTVSWYNINTGQGGTVEIPEDLRYSSTFDIVDNKIYFNTTDFSGNNGVGVIDLETKAISEKFAMKDTMGLYVLNDNNIVATLEEHDEGNYNAGLFMLNIKNKTKKEIAKLDDTLSKVILSPSRDKIIFNEFKDGKRVVYAAYINEDGLFVKCKLYEHQDGSYRVHYSFSNNSNEIVLVEYSYETKSVEKVMTFKLSE